MSTTLRSLSAEQRRKLIERLSAIATVRQFDVAGEPQAATLVHSLTDLEQSFRKILDELLPKLQDKGLSADRLNDVLHDIGEELRHVLYHVQDTKYFGYLINE
jgi:uncharacterized membrane-anchored protein